MRTQTVGMILVVSCGLLFAGGCAKHAMVSKDESIAPAAAAAAKPPVKTEEVKTEAVKAQPVTEASAKESAALKGNISAAERKRLVAGLEKVYFDFDAYKLSDQARATLVNDAELLRKAPVAKVRIEGNCDERGSDEYNLALGERRAKTAMQYLVTMGIPANDLSAISYGKEKPADPGHDEAAWGKNRRDELVVVMKK
jgi:peptidoglycan-associated lipoprotein